MPLRTRPLLVALALVAPCPVLAAPAAPTAPAAAPKVPVLTPASVPVPYPDVERSSSTTSKLMSDAPSLEKLWTSTAKTHAKRPDLGLRLARHYLELSLSAAADLAAATTPADKTKHDKVRTAALSRATDVLRAVVDDHPDYARVDEALYLLARSHRGTSPDKARAAYLELIKKAPASKYVGWAYLDFGDLYYDDAVAGRIDWAIAKAAYERASSAFGPDGDGYGYAQYRLGHVEANLGAKAAARKALGLAKDFAAKHPTVKGAAELGAEASRALAAL